MRELDLHSLEHEVLNGLLNGVSPQEMCDIVRYSTNLPVILMDLSMQCIAFSFDRPFYYFPWELASYRKLPNNQILEHGWLHEQEKMYSSGKSTIFEAGTNALAPAAAGPVLHNGILLAYSGIMIEDTDRDQTLAANDLLSMALSIILANDSSAVPEYMQDNTFSQIMLSVGNTKPEVIDAFNRSCPPPFLYCVLSSPSDVSVASLQYIRSELHKETRKVLSVLEGEQKLCLLFFDLDKPQQLEQSLALLEMICKKYDLLCGVSEPFDLSSLISAHHAQAKLARDAAVDCRGERIYHFYDYYNEILFSLADSELGQLGMEHPQITRLQETDKTTGSKYCETLDAYINHFLNTKDTADVLKLHKNTIISRVNKMEGLLHIKLGKQANANNLVAGLDISKYYLKKSEK